LFGGHLDLLKRARPDVHVTWVIPGVADECFGEGVIVLQPQRQVDIARLRVITGTAAFAVDEVIPTAFAAQAAASIAPWCAAKGRMRN
jgi:hypothetical protein